MISPVSGARFQNLAIADVFAQHANNRRKITKPPKVNPNDIIIENKLEQISNDLKEDRKFQAMLESHSASSDYDIHIRLHSDGNDRYLVIEDIRVGRPLKEPKDFTTHDLSRSIYKMPRSWKPADNEFSIGVTTILNKSETKGV